MTERPIPIDLAPFADMLAGTREFLRVWVKEDGPVSVFVNPRPIGADPAAFGVALVDCIRHAAMTYANVTALSEKEALARIWEGVDAERAAADDTGLPPPVAVARRDED